MKLRPILALFLSTPICSFSLLAASPLYAESENPLVSQYIEKHKGYAIAEMERMGIPASVKLAQGVHESNYGQSLLALEANNHFGTKCGSNWQGRTYYKNTQEYVNGQYVTDPNACFRSFDNVQDSYRAHSDLIASRPSYTNLFRLSTLDYKGWAAGLKLGGYASDPEYDKKIIKIIEQYQLFKYDKEMNSLFAINEVSPANYTATPNQSQTSNYNSNSATSNLEARLAVAEAQIKLLTTLVTECTNIIKQQKEEQVFINETLQKLLNKQVEIIDDVNNKIAALDGSMEHQYALMELYKKRLEQAESTLRYVIKSDPLKLHFDANGNPILHHDFFAEPSINSEYTFALNGARVTYMREGQNMMSIASSFEGMTYADLLKLNDMTEADDTGVYPPNFYVYLSRKANTSSEPSNHQIKNDETMFLISQRYGVRLSRLLQMNGLKKGEEPAAGEFIYMNSNAPQKPKLR